MVPLTPSLLLRTATAFTMSSVIYGNNNVTNTTNQVQIKSKSENVLYKSY